MDKPTVLVCSLSDANRDPRVYRQLQILSINYQVVFAGYGCPSLAGVSFIDLHIQGLPLRRDNPVQKLIYAIREKELAIRLIELITGIFPVAKKLALFDLEDRFWGRTTAATKIASVITRLPVKVIIANDFQSLAICGAIANGIPVIYDAHEYTPSQSHDSYWLNRKVPYILHALSKYLPSLAGMMTVSEGIAEKYRDDFNIPKPLVHLNAPARAQLQARPHAQGKIRLVHHGICTRGRSLETMIDVMNGLDDRFSLDLFLVVRDEEYYRELSKRAAGNARISFQEPVNMCDLPVVLNSYDVGIVFFPPKTVNLQHVLPNKFFEYIQARICVAIGPSPEMKAIVNKYDIGIVSDDFTPESLGRALCSIAAEQLDKMKANTEVAANILNAESQASVIQNMIADVLVREVPSRGK